MIDLKENNLPGDFRGELFADLEQCKFQVPEPVNVKEYIDRRIKEEVTAQVERINKMIGDTSRACWCRPRLEKNEHYPTLVHKSYYEFPWYKRMIWRIFGG